MRRVIMKLEGRGFGGRPLVTGRPPKTPDGRTREERRTDREMWRQGYRGDCEELSDWSSEDEDDADVGKKGEKEGGEKKGGEKDGGEKEGGEESEDGGEKESGEDGGEQGGGEKDGGEEEEDGGDKAKEK